MSEQTLFQTLRAIRFLDGTSDEERRQLASVARLEEHGPDAVVFREGECNDTLFLVAEGSVALDVRVPEHGARWAQTVNAGELLGWSPVLDHVPLTATARAVTACRLVALDAPGLLALCERRPQIGFLFMHRLVGVLARRLAAARRQLFEAYRAGLPVVAGIHEGSD